MKNPFSRIVAALLAAILLVGLGIPAKAAADDTSFFAKLRIWDDENSVCVRLLADTVNAALSGSAEASIMGYQQIYDMDGSFYADAGRIAVSSGSFLDRCYGIDLAGIVRNLPKSVLHPDSGSDFALDRNAYDLISQALDIFSLSEPESNKLLPYWNILKETVDANLQSTSGTEKRTLGGRSVTAQVSTYTLDSDFFAALAESLAEEAGRDSSLKAMTAMYFEMDGTARCAEMSGEKYADSIWDSWDAYTAELVDAIRQAAPSLTLKTYTCVELSAAELTITVEKEPVRFLLTIDRAQKAVTLSAVDRFGEQLRAECKLNRNGISLDVTEKGRSVLRGYLNYAPDRYMLSLSDRPMSSYGWESVSGRIIRTENSVTFTMDSVNGESDVRAELTLGSSEEAVRFPEFLDLLTLSKEEAELLAIYLFNTLRKLDF